MVMLLAGPSATLRGKLTEKVKYRPTAKIAPLLPAGTDTLESLVKVRPEARPETRGTQVQIGDSDR